MDGNAVKAIIEQARAGVAPIEVRSTLSKKTLVIPGHGEHAAQVIEVDCEAGAERPYRKRGKVTVFDAASFNMVLKDNADAGDIAIYIDRHPEKPAVVAVLNGNGVAGPGWGDFRAEIQFRPTPQWMKWKAMDGKLVQQVQFSEFLEENLDDVAEPAGAMLLEIATYLSAVRTVNFKSGVKLHSGIVTLQHEETDEVKAGALELPETFTLGITPVYGLASYAVPARLRYRIQDRKLYLGFKLQRMETLMQKIVDDVVTKIERGANISVFDGLAPT
jgi:uncharacterized protein YfdQ (DUF2303 family)